MKILLVEDNLDLADNIRDYLDLQGIEVDFAANGGRFFEASASRRSRLSRFWIITGQRRSS